MITLRIVLLTFVYSLSAQARSLNFIESQQLRLSAQQNPVHWVLPFNVLKKASSWEINTFLSSEEDVFSLYKDIDSKDQALIQERLQSSFGQPYDVTAKMNFGFRNGNFAQFFSTNGGAVLLVTDPVFPEVKGLLFHDYMGSSSYLFRPTKNLLIKPQLNYGTRKILDRQFTVGDLVEKKISVDFNKAPQQTVVETNVMAVLGLESWGQILFEMNSFPLIKTEYQYWESFLGYMTPNFLSGTSWIQSLQFYGGYSPVYAGSYDVERTVKTGSKLMLGEHLTIDIFTTDKFYPGAMVGYMAGFVEVSAFTFERAYDDFGLQRSRQFGGNLRLYW